MIKFNAVFVFFLLVKLVSCQINPIEMFEKFKGGEPQILTQAVEVPFELEASHIIKIPVAVNGVKLEMVLDTGGITMLDESVCDSLQLEIIEIPNQQAGFTKLTEIVLGETRVFGMKAGVTNFNQTYKFAQSGMIGSDYLRFFQTEIDYARQMLVFNNPSLMLSESELEHVFQMEIILPYFPTIELVLNDTYPLPGMIDTGLSYGFVLPVSWKEKLADNQEITFLEADGYFARWPWNDNPRNYLSVMPQISMGDIVLENVPVLFAEIPSFLDQDVLLIGKYFLDDFLLRLDFQNRQLKLTETEGPDYDLLYSAGLMISTREENIKITGVWENSPAREAGLKPGHLLKKINDKGFEEISQKEISDILMNREIKSVKITLEEEGEEKEYFLEKRLLIP
ncbi:MAG: hypothetical protein JW784_04290 [Candidatus Cloacimonetes bacterium]|nr:hypothetical protein [Candidatus Cloacimonadota bacterium]